MILINYFRADMQYYSETSHLRLNIRLKIGRKICKHKNTTYGFYSSFQFTKVNNVTHLTIFILHEILE